VCLAYHFSGGEPSVFDRFELGEIMPDEFRARLRREFLLSGSDEDLDSAWNALLVRPIGANVALLPSLKKRYRLIMLSNTNYIHIEHVRRCCADLVGHFERSYFSHELGMRKPGTEIFQHVLEDSQLIPGETLFIDDSERNTAGARVFGIEVLHLEKPEILESALSEFSIAG